MERSNKQSKTNHGLTTRREETKGRPKKPWIGDIKQDDLERLYITYWKKFGRIVEVGEQ
jgi:hypothetical protein